MSEYWVSHKKYFCRYCEIYIADDVPSKRQHENGLRHKGNVERFIRGLYKTSEKQKKESEDEKRELARVEKAAQAAFAQDVSAGLVKPGAPSVSTTASAPAPPRKPPAKPTNPYTNYTTAASLGYTDPDAERLLAETERRRTEGVAGDWELLAPPPPPPPPEPTVEDIVPSTSDPGPSLKREAAPEIDEEDARHFKLHKKTLGSGLGEIYDPGIIPIKLKKKKEEQSNSGETAETQVAPIPKWTKVQWKKVDQVLGQTPEGRGGMSDAGGEEIDNKPEVRIKSEEVPSAPEVHSESVERGGVPVKLEETPPIPSAVEVGGSLFRKRKTPAGAGRGKKQI